MSGSDPTKIQNSKILLHQDRQPPISQLGGGTSVVVSTAGTSVVSTVSSCFSKSAASAFFSDWSASATMKNCIVFAGLIHQTASPLSFRTLSDSDPFSFPPDTAPLVSVMLFPVHSQTAVRCTNPTKERRACPMSMIVYTNASCRIHIGAKGILTSFLSGPEFSIFCSRSVRIMKVSSCTGTTMMMNIAIKHQYHQSLTLS